MRLSNFGYMVFFEKGGVGCSVNCRCEGCKNTFGRKDGKQHFVYNFHLSGINEVYDGFNSGSDFIGSEMDVEMNVADEGEGNGSDGSLQMILHNEGEHVSATPATPSRFGR